MIPHLITEDCITVMLQNGTVSKSLCRKSPQFSVLLQALKDDLPEAEIAKLFDLKEATRRFAHGQLTVEGETIKYNGTEVHGTVVRRIFDFMARELPWEPLAKFLERLMANPSRRSVETLYPFLEHSHLAITSDGKIRGYKAIRNDWKDKYSGTVDNQIGTLVPRMQRNRVDDDPNVACSFGYHFGNLEYVKGFANGYGQEGGDRIIIVEADPADIVAVPNDCNHGKVRCVQYLVVGEYTGPLPEYVSTEPGDLVDDDPTQVPGADDLKVVESVNYCSRCGKDISDLDEPKYCPDCGAELH